MRGRRDEAGCPKPGVERCGLAKAEFSQHGALQARSERGCGREPESRAHRHPEDTDMRIVGEPQVGKRGDDFQPVRGHPAVTRSMPSSAMSC